MRKLKRPYAVITRHALMIAWERHPHTRLRGLVTHASHKGVIVETEHGRWTNGRPAWTRCRETAAWKPIRAKLKRLEGAPV